MRFIYLILVRNELYIKWLRINETIAVDQRIEESNEVSQTYQSFLTVLV